MHKVIHWLSSAGALGAGAMLAVYVAGPALGSGPVAQLTVETRPVPLSSSDPTLATVGRLRYLGGVQLSANDTRFGGLSGMLWNASCKRLLAVSDSGAWVVLEPDEQGERLAGIRAAWIAPVNGPDGNAPLSKRAADAEALARLSDGSTWVFYEQDHRAERFPAISACQPETLGSIPDRRWVPPETAGWPANGGMEAVSGEGMRFVILSEQVPGKPGRRAGLWGEPGTALEAFSWDAPDSHEPTEIAALNPGSEDGRMLVLHRSFSPLAGVSVILSEGDFSAPVRDRIEATEIARMRPPITVDNMEALAVRVEGERRFVYMVSDDNFNALQRTLLLKFELLPPEKTTP